MTLASRLQQISKAEEPQKTELSEKFAKDVVGHPEEKTLLDCLVQAKLNRGFLDFGRNMFAPNTLKGEGFHLEMAGPGFHLHFD